MVQNIFNIYFLFEHLKQSFVDNNDHFPLLRDRQKRQLHRQNNEGTSTHNAETTNKETMNQITL